MEADQGGGGEAGGQGQGDGGAGAQGAGGGGGSGPGGPLGPPRSGRGHPFHGRGGAVAVREKGQGGGRGGRAGKGEVAQGGGARGRGGGGGTAAGQPQSGADAHELGLGVSAAGTVAGWAEGDVAELARYVKWAEKTRGRRDRRRPRPFSDLVGRAGRPGERGLEMEEWRWRRMLGAALGGVRLDCPQEKGKKPRVQMPRELLQREGQYGGDA